MRDELRSLQDLLNTARAREAQLQHAKIKAEAEHDQALEARRKLLLDGDPNDSKTLAGVDRRLGESERAIAGLADALKLASERAERAEHALAALRDRMKREAEAKRTLEVAAEIEQAFIGFKVATEPLVAALRKMHSLQGDSLANAINGIPVDLQNDVTGLGCLVPELKGYARDLIANRVAVRKPPILKVQEAA
jgi:tetratricopeptide (TPR) repeat protein